jgi:hypothetical protein
MLFDELHHEDQLDFYENILDMSEIETLAFVKMFLHLAKYPELAVNGVLLSDRMNSTNDEADSSSYLHFVDCIPLFHGVLSLSPMLEIALSQVMRVRSLITIDYSFNRLMRIVQHVI